MSILTNYRTGDVLVATDAGSMEEGSILVCYDFFLVGDMMFSDGSDIDLFTNEVEQDIGRGLLRLMGANEVYANRDRILDACWRIRDSLMVCYGESLKADPMCEDTTQGLLNGINELDAYAVRLVEGLV